MNSDIVICVTRTEAAYRAHSKVAEKIKALSDSLGIAFNELEIATSRMHEEGIRTEIVMAEWLQAAYSHWRTANEYVEPPWRDHRYAAAMEMV